MKDKGRNDNMKIGIANDHSAVDMKNEVVDYLKSLGHEVERIRMKAVIIRNMVKSLVMQWQVERSIRELQSVEPEQESLLQRTK